MLSNRQRKDKGGVSFFLRYLNTHLASSIFKSLGELELTKIWPRTLKSRDKEWKEKDGDLKGRGERDGGGKGEDEGERGGGEKAFFWRMVPCIFTSYPILQMLKLKFKAIGGPTFVPSLIAHGLDWGPDSHPTTWWKHKQVKRRLPRVSENPAQEQFCGYCQSSPTSSLLLSASACSSLFPWTCQKKKEDKEKLPRASRDKDYFPW